MVSKLGNWETGHVQGIGLRLPRWKIDQRLYPWLVVGVALIASLVSFIYFYNQGMTLAYYDAQARLLITRRVIESSTPGFAQLGSVWLPLTHILALPLIGIDALYHSGLALSLISMLSFVLTALYLYHTVVLLTKDRFAGLIGAAILIINPNILYMQSTPMTELPMFCSMIAAIYYLLRLSREPENRTWLFASSFTIALSTLIRYESWILLIIEVLILGYIALRKRFSFRKAEGLLIYWGYWAFAGIVAWLAWGWLIFGDPLSFQRGEYAKASLWVGTADATVHNLDISLRAYTEATWLTVGPLVLLGLIGLGYYLWRTRLRVESIAPLAFLALFPFFVAMLYLGQRPLWTPETTDGMYNIRFALVMVLPVAIFVAYLAQSRWWAKATVIALIVSATELMIASDGIITLKESSVVFNEKRYIDIQHTAAWLKDNYDNQPMLLESYGNDQLQFLSAIPLRNVIYEGSYRMWNEALAFPEEHVEWVVMRYAAIELIPEDKVWQSQNERAVFYEHFEQVYENDLYRIFRRKGGA